MAVKMLLALLVQSLILLPRVGPDEVDVAMHQRMKEREKMLDRETTRLLRKLEQATQSSSTGLGLLSAASQQGHIWASAVVPVLIFGFCWWHQKRSPRNRVDMEKQEEKPRIALDVDSIFSTRNGNLSELIASVHNVMDQLLCKCQEQSKKDFYPVLQTPFNLKWESEDPSHLQYFGICCLIMPMKAPRGHSFHRVPGTTGELQEGTIRVELECTCEKEHLDMLCFLHHSKEELSEKQPPSLLDTLCTGCYLDLVKTSSWFKKLVKSSWNALPEVNGCRLAVMSTSRLCRLKLMCTADVTLLVEMELAVEED